MNDEQLTQRMRAASEALQMSDSSQARHLEAISDALSSTAAPDADIVPLSAARAGRRRRMVASIVAAAVIAPAGLAAASEGSIPGDALYPVKQLSERVLVMFDADVIAQHRIEEIEALEATGRFDADLYDDARAALTELGEHHPLWERLASAAPHDDHDGDSTPSAPVDDDDRSEDVPTTDFVVELALPDGTKATATLVDDALAGLAVPPGWTVAEMDDDEATLDHEDYIVEVRLSNGSFSLDVNERERLESDDDESSEAETTSATVSDDDESSESVASSGSDRAGESDSAETDSGDDDRNDDDASESP